MGSNNTNEIKPFPKKPKEIIVTKETIKNESK